MAMNTLTGIDLVQLLSTTLLCGLIWTVQLVHYPAFRFIKTTTAGWCPR